MLNRGTVTRAELEALDKMRTDPYLAYEMTPSGLEFSKMKYDLQRWQSRRAHYLHARLAIAGHKLRTEFDRER